jgi:tRNA A37 methylthiotransferase MiaB
MKKVIIIGCAAVMESIHEAEIRAIALNKNVDLVFANSNHEKLKEAILNIEDKNITNLAFERKSIELINHHLEWNEPKIYNDIPRNKYIDKPKHNYKKR